MSTPDATAPRGAAPRYRAAPRHRDLGGDFFDVVEPASFPRSTLRHRDDRWAARVGLASLDDDAWCDHFARFEPLPDNLEQPLALRYHGHQFQSYNPDLGDGRGFLFAQLLDDADDRLLDLGTKGSGQTPWSRAGDGRLTLKGGVREVLATAMLEALGVYTSKSFSLIETGEELQRGDEPSPTRSSVLVRLSHSHVRFGSFQRQAFLERPDNLQKLVDYSIAQYMPELANEPPETRAASLLRVVAVRSADLVASWMVAGFVHGVLNTDNMNVTGESFDYGPYRFLPTLDPSLTAAYFDQTGLYAYGRQPSAVAFNLSRLAEALLPIAERDALIGALQGFQRDFDTAYTRRTLERLGLQRSVQAPDRDEGAFIRSLYGFLHGSQIGFEQFFFDWYGGLASADRARRSPEAAHYESEAFSELARELEAYEPSHPEALEHPYFQAERPCTLLIDEVEALWAHIADDDDWSAFQQKLGEIECMRTALTSPSR